MARRFQQHEEAIRVEWSRGVQTIHDRSIWGDRAFADMLRKDGLISDLGYSSYMMHRDCMLGFLLVPQVVIWLEADPQVCLDRIHQRDRSCESGISLEYLKALRDSYTAIIAEMEKKGSRIMYYDWTKIPPAEKILQDLKNTDDKVWHFQESYYRKAAIYFTKAGEESNNGHNGNGNGNRLLTHSEQGSIIR